MSLKTVVELLNKQRIVESMVRTQGTRRSELVESVVHNQHIAEMQALLSRLPAVEISRILQTLSAEDAQAIWEQVDAKKRNDVLWETPTSLGALLASGEDPQFQTGEITACEQFDGRMRIAAVSSRSQLENIRPVWVDVLGASKAERGWIARRFGLELPTPEDFTDLEVSSRFYVEENGEVHLHSNFLFDRDGNSRSVPVTFIVHNGILFTVRSEELPVFRLQRLRIRNQTAEVLDCKDLLLALYAADIEYSADALEDAYATLRRVGKKVLSENVSDADAARILADIAEEEDLNGRIRSNMLDTQRAVSFLIRSKFLSPEQLEDAKEIIRDIESLNSHTAFLFEKINFLMDSTVGFININQNKRVSQLTVAGVVFMPLNVLAGIGGMSEFSMMTQGVPWPAAYGAFTLGMILVGWATYQTLRYYENRVRRRAQGDAKER